MSTSLPDLPGKPTTFHVLCSVPLAEDVDASFASAKAAGIEIAGTALQREEALTVVLQVLDWGPDAFADKARFPSGPVCERGGFVLVRSSTGTRVKYKGREFRVINDDHIDMVVTDPLGLIRA